MFFNMYLLCIILKEEMKGSFAIDSFDQFSRDSSVIFLDKSDEGSNPWIRERGDLLVAPSWLIFHSLFKRVR